MAQFGDGRVMHATSRYNSPVRGSVRSGYAVRCVGLSGYTVTNLTNDQLCTFQVQAF